ncbi:MAG: U32 family peptidase [Ruminococcaceae bacterium]|nr:U32 family peptidase [Oscillospiraceae bacterium]
MANRPLPELLAPAGSPEALRAAIAAGADAVYFGGGAFNARMRAQNFDDEATEAAIRLCHAYGVKAYMTFNTLITDREMPAFLVAAEKAYLAGVDALIVADLGAAAVLRQALPLLPLHASTQCSAHNAAGARALAERGFCRVVPARELSAADIATIKRESNTEIEIFIHGALCVSHSGQCLFSSLVGGRSGNRGECAQPCRLPDANGKYPLSLKDLCLAREIPFFIENGIDSLKIEGRLKSPQYVYEVVSIYRRLLDERRAATDREMAALAAIFSRSGFTDGYFKGKVGREMLGVRTEADKQQSASKETTITLPPVPLALRFRMKANEPVALTLQKGEKTVTVTGDIPLVAQNAPMDAAAVSKNLCRFGGTPYTVAETDIDVDAGLMMPVSRLNALRRAALAALETEQRASAAQLPPLPQLQGTATAPTASFTSLAQLTPKARHYFARCYLPLALYDDRAAALTDSVAIPPVIMDHEWPDITKMLQKATERGAKHALVSNIGHLAAVKAAGLIPHGDLRLNICNSYAAADYLANGMTDLLLSPELTLPQMRDIGGARRAVIYGSLPLMLLEKCAGRELGGCTACDAGKVRLVDRRGEKFPVLRLPGSHRSVIYNSHPTVMSDRPRELMGAGLSNGHFLFTTETADQVDAVINAYQRATPLYQKIRRM